MQNVYRRVAVSVYMQPAIMTFVSLSLAVRAVHYAAAGASPTCVMRRRELSQLAGPFYLAIPTEFETAPALPQHLPIQPAFLNDVLTWLVNRVLSALCHVPDLLILEYDEVVLPRSRSSLHMR